MKPIKWINREAVLAQYTLESSTQLLLVIPDPTIGYYCTTAIREKTKRNACVNSKYSENAFCLALHENQREGNSQRFRLSTDVLCGKEQRHRTVMNSKVLRRVKPFALVTVSIRISQRALHLKLLLLQYWRKLIQPRPLLQGLEGRLRAIVTHRICRGTSRMLY